MTNKPLVLVFTTAYRPFIGGAEVAIEETVKRLKDRFDFYIVTSRFKHSLPRREIFGGATILRAGWGILLDKYLWLPLAALWYTAKFARFRPILWGMDISQGSLIAAVLKVLFPNLPFIFTIQYGYGEERLLKGRLGLLGLSFRFILGRADYVTAISTYLLDLARRYGYSGPADVIHNGVDLEKFKNQNAKIKITDKSSKIVITTSRLVPKNGIDILIRAVAVVKKQMPDVQCHILGEGEERSGLELEIRNLKLEQTVKLLGQVPHNELPKYLAAADVFVRPSRSEGMGNSFVEALAVGLPIIGTSVGGITDIIKDGETGIFAKVDDPKDLAEKIILLFRNQALAASIVEKGRKMIQERFSWEKIALDYGKVFGSYCGKRVLITTGIFPPEIGGPATYSKLLLEELPSYGFQVRVFPFREVRHLPYALRHLIYFLKTLKYGYRSEIIFAQDTVSVGFPSALAARILRKKFFVKIVGDHAWEQGVQRFGVKDLLDEFLSRRYGFMVEALRWIEKLTARWADKIIVPSDYLKEVVKHWGIPEGKIKVIYNSFEPEEVKESREAIRKKYGLDGTVITSIGRLVPWKGFEALIEVMPRIAREIPEAKLLIIGSGPEEEKLRQRIKELRLDSNIKLLGSLSHQITLGYLRSSDIFILNTGYEGFSHTLLEAMAANVPVITTAVGGNREIVEDGRNGLVVGFDNQEEIKQAVIRLARDKGLRQKLAAGALKKLNDFTKEKMLRETSEALRSLRVLMLSTDPTILIEGSEAHERTKSYASCFDKLYIVVASSKKLPLRLAEFLGKTLRVALKVRPDVISAQGPDEFGLLGFGVAKLCGISFHLQVHTDIFSPWYRRASWKEWLRYLIARFLIPRAYSLRVVSERIKNSIRLHYLIPESRISVLPIFTDVSKFRNASRSPETDRRFHEYDFKMLAVGRLVDKEKNFSMLIEIMQDFVKICPKALLVIVGYGPDKEKYEGLVNKYNLEKNVIIGSEGEVKRRLFTSTERTNYIERSEDILESWRDGLASFYKSFDLYLMSSNYEGWGRTAIEAMAAGLPIVMTDVGLAGEVVQNRINGVVVSVGNKDAFLQACLELYQSSDRRQKLTRAGEKTIRIFVERKRENYLALYRKVYEVTCGYSKS